MSTTWQETLTPNNRKSHVPSGIFPCVSDRWFACVCVKSTGWMNKITTTSLTYSYKPQLDATGWLWSSWEQKARTTGHRGVCNVQLQWIMSLSTAAMMSPCHIHLNILALWHLKCMNNSEKHSSIGSDHRLKLIKCRLDESWLNYWCVSVCGKRGGGATGPPLWLLCFISDAWGASRCTVTHCAARKPMWRFNLAPYTQHWLFDCN